MNNLLILGRVTKRVSFDTHANRNNARAMVRFVRRIRRK